MNKMLKAADTVNCPISYIQNSNGNKVLEWINRFVMHSCNTASDMNIMYDTFRAGYCYFFAHMLQDAFQRGTVCLAAPFSHWVWEDTDKQLYDIGGLYDGEALYFIPEEEYTLDDIDSFFHLDTPELDDKTIEAIRTAKDRCKQMMLEYCARHNMKYNDYADYLLYNHDEGF